MLTPLLRLRTGNTGTFGTVKQTGVIKDALTPCYGHVEVAYWHNKKIKVVGKILIIS